MLVVECHLDALTLDETAFPDRDRHYIYDHLKHYCSRLRVLPAVVASVDRIPPVVVERHKYFRIARELGIESIRAVVTGDEQSSEFKAFLRRPDVRIVDSAVIAQEMEDSMVDEVPHVFFLQLPLTGHAKAAFDARIAGFFRTVMSPLLAGRQRRVSQVQFAFGDTCAEFTAVTPVGDESCCAEFLRTNIEFSQNVVPIVSYQGGRFPW